MSNLKENLKGSISPSGMETSSPNTTVRGVDLGLKAKNNSIKANAQPHSPGWGDNRLQYKFAPNKTRRGNRKMKI